LHNDRRGGDYTPSKKQNHSGVLDRFAEEKTQCGCVNKKDQGATPSVLHPIDLATKEGKDRETVMQYVAASGAK